MKTYILITCGNGYCGCETEEVYIYDEDVSEESIQQDALELMYNNAESYAHVYFGWDEEYTDEEYEEYLENNCSYDYHEISREEYIEWCENYGYIPKEE